MVAFLSKETLERLNFDLWLGFFEKKIRLSDNPFFEGWYRKTYDELKNYKVDVTVNPDAKWQRVTALLSIVRERFHSLSLPVPETWRESHEQDTFSLFDVRDTDLPHFKVHSWLQQFYFFEDGQSDWLDVGNEHEIWWFRKGLVDEFISLYFAEIKKLIAQSGIERNKALRELIVEASFYRQSFALSNGFDKKVEPFVKSIKADKSDPIIDFVKKVLTGVFIDEGRDIDRKAIVMTMLEGYWEKLKKSEKPSELVDLISAEVRELINFLTLEID